MSTELVHQSRYRLLNSVKPQQGKTQCILYWMLRSHRIQNNHSLLLTQQLSRKHSLPIKILFPFHRSFDQMSLRQYQFMVDGLKEVEKGARELGLDFDVVDGGTDVGVTVGAYAKDVGARCVVTDAFPLRTPNSWKEGAKKILDENNVEFFECDSENVVPVWVASDKQEVGARTIRKKIDNNLREFLTPFAPLAPVGGKGTTTDTPAVDWDSMLKLVDVTKVDVSVAPVTWLKGGGVEGRRVFDKFCETKLKTYADVRNDPNEDVQSDLSPYLRFGQISFQQIVLDVKALKKHHNGTASFVEEGLVRRELSDNFCHYNPKYDSLEGAAGWARESLELHQVDEREYVYSETILTEGKTHDDLWNAAQKQLTTTGKMHGFLRMYWAKKILEWTSTPAEALRIAQKLNDVYSLDGNSCNGYVGVGWSIMGVHDMGWKERPVFGKIRFMNYNGCKRKFDVKGFVAKWQDGGGGVKRVKESGVGGSSGTKKKAKKM